MWKTRERYKWMCFLFFGGVGLYASRVALPICSVAISDELGWNRQEMGLILGVFFWGYAMTQFLAGYLSDRLGGERVIPLSSMLWSLTTLFFAHLPQTSEDLSLVYGAFVCARFFLGVFQGFYYPSLVSLMSRRVHPSERNFTHAVLNAGTHMGTLLCGSLGSYLVVQNGWRSLFACIGILFSSWSVVTYLVMVHPRPIKLPTLRISPIHSDSELDLSAADGQRHSVGNEKSSLKFAIKYADHRSSHLTNPTKPISWITLLRHPPFWAMLLANLVHNNSFYVILNWCPTYFHDNYPDARSWVFNMVPWLIIFPSVLVSGLVADRWVCRGVSVTYVRKAINTVVLIGSSFFLLLLTSIEDYYSALTCMALALACLGFHSSGVLLNPQDIAPSHGGKLYGIMATVGTIPGFVGVYFAGYLLEVTQQWSFVFAWTALISISGWFVYTKYGSSEPIT